MVDERGFYTDWQEKIGGVHEEGIVEAILDLFVIRTAIDLGCGAGRYTKQMIDMGIDCKGFDGNPNTPEMTDGLCGVLDLTKPFDKGKFDLVFCLEVGEHIPEQYTDVFLDNLCRACDGIIVMSWAIVGSEWEGHVNCQNNIYVIHQMERRSFLCDGETTAYLRTHLKHWGHFSDSLLVFR